MSRQKKLPPPGELNPPPLHYPAGELAEGVPECWGLIAWSQKAGCNMIYFFDADGDKQGAVPVEDPEEIEWTKANLWRFSQEWHVFNKWKENRAKEKYFKP